MTVPDIQRGDVYFISHGVSQDITGHADLQGPPTMFDYGSLAHTAWKTVGQRLKERNPKGIVAVSAHWENPVPSPDVIVNVDTTNPLIYDFYGFPKHFYEQTFESAGNKQQVSDVKAALRDGDVNATEEKRGLDHGVWVPFKVGFEGQTDIPLIQVSLPGNSDVASSVKLGKALSSLRDQGYAILGTGQVVHNLADLFSGRPMPYTEPFMREVDAALASSHPVDAVSRLVRHPLYKSAHPTDEHYLGLPVAVAATDARDTMEPIATGVDKGLAGLGWGFWRWSSQ